MANFNTLYYDVRCKIYLKGAKIYKVLNRKRLRLDYESNKKIIQDIKILSLFENNINELCLKYNTTIDNIVIKSVDFTQTENMNNFINFTIKDDRVIVHTLDEETYFEKTEYIIEVLNDSIRIIISNYNPNYIYQFKCNGVIDNFDYDTYCYKHSSNEFSFDIITYYQDIIINTVSKNVKLNDITLSNSTIVNKDNVENIHTNPLKLFENGLEDIENIPYITNSSLSETFDIHANVKGLTDSNVSIYPKVTTSYDVNCTYDYLVDQVTGKFTYESTLDYNGIIKCKLTKFASDLLKTTYDICCKVTFFETQTSGYKTWVTKDVTLSRTKEFDLFDEFFIGDTINYSGKCLVKTPDNDSVYTLMNNKAKTLYSLGSNYSLHSYSIRNIKCYINNVLSTNSDMQYILPAFYSNDSLSNIDASKPIRYMITPSIYSDEKTVEATVGKASTVIVNDASFNFPVTNTNGIQYTGTRYKYKISILNISSYIKYTIQNNTLTAWSIKSSSHSNTFEFNDTFTSITLNLSEEMKIPADLDITANAKVKITCVSDAIYIAGTKYTSGQFKEFTLTGKPKSMIFGVTATIKKVTKTNTIRLPENKDDVFRASLNGNEVTYATALKGKEDYIQKEEPFIIPPNTTNIRYTINTFNTLPKNATIVKTITPTTDQTTHSMILKLSSDYTENIVISNYTLLDTQVFKNYTLVDGYIKDFVLNIKKPTVVKPNYQISLESTNPNILLEYNKSLVFDGSSKNVTVKCYTTKHPACKWQLMIPSSYCYYGEDEYFTYNKKIIATPNDDNKIFVGRKISSTNPICIMNETSTLTRVISTEEDGITIKETLNSDDKYFFTSYKNINIKMVLDESLNEISFVQYNHYFYSDTKQCTVYYTVSDSFDYKISEVGTTISLNTSHNGTVDLYYNNDEYIRSNISLNPIHTNIDSGCVYISDTVENIAYHKVHVSQYNDIYCYIIELLDKYNNPISKVSSPTISNVGANTSVIYMTKESNVGIITIKLKSNTNVRTETITVNNYNIKL